MVHQTSQPPRATLPSATFLALTQKNLPVKDFKQMKKALDDGFWHMEANEVDPRTGLSFLQTVARDQSSDDEVKRQLIFLSVAYGADVNEKAPDGTSVLAWAKNLHDWETARWMEDLGAVDSGPNARQKEVLLILRDFHDTIFSPRTLVEKIQDPKGFGTVDASHEGTPLGLLAVARTLGVNGAKPKPMAAREPANPKKIQINSMETWRDFGLAAMEKEPHCQLGMWCWLAIASITHWSGDLAPSLAATWRGYEKTLLRKRYPEVKNPEDRLRAFQKDLTAMLVETVASYEKKPRLQPLTAYGLSSVRAWINRWERDRPENLPKILEILEPGLLTLAAELATAIPIERFAEEKFAQGWVSASYYALEPMFRRRVGALAENSPWFPPFVLEHRPWLSLTPVLLDAKEEASPPSERATALMEALVAQPDDVEMEKIKLLYVDRPEVWSELTASRLDRILETKDVPAVRSPRF